MTLTKHVGEVNDRFGDIPIYTECEKYYFESITATTYTNAIAPNKDEVN